MLRKDIVGKYVITIWRIYRLLKTNEWQFAVIYLNEQFAYQHSMNVFDLQNYQLAILFIFKNWIFFKGFKTTYAYICRSAATILRVPLCLQVNKPLQHKLRCFLHVREPTLARICGEGLPRPLLTTLDAIHKTAIKLIGYWALCSLLDSIFHCRIVSALSLYKRYYNVKSFRKSHLFKTHDFLLFF